MGETEAEQGTLPFWEGLCFSTLVLISEALCRGFHSATAALGSLYLPLPCRSLLSLLLSVL